MKQQIKASDVNDIIKGKIAENRVKLDKLDAVDGMLTASLVEEKKSIILDIVFAIQEVQGEVLNLAEEEMNKSQNGEEIEANAKAVETAKQLSVVGSIPLGGNTDIDKYATNSPNRMAEVVHVDSLLCQINNTDGSQERFYLQEAFKYYMAYFKDIHSGSVSCGCTKKSCEGCSVMEDLNNPTNVLTVDEILSQLSVDHKVMATELLGL